LKNPGNGKIFAKTGKKPGRNREIYNSFVLTIIYFQYAHIQQFRELVLCFIDTINSIQGRIFFHLKNRLNANSKRKKIKWRVPALIFKGNIIRLVSSHPSVNL
jgi:hypothetical protein